MGMSILPRFSPIDDDDDDVAGAIRPFLSSLPPPHHTANESQSDIDFRDILGFHVR